MFDNHGNLRKSGGYIDHLLLKIRLKMLSLFTREFPANTFTNVLDVGVTADINALSSNYFEKYFPVKSKIIALSNQDATFLEDIYPGLKFMQGDAKKLPFADASLDVVFSSAVLEHMGSLANQKQMISECFRVAKKGVFLTTPNRWHPIDVYTFLPLLHWLPKKIHHFILKLTGTNANINKENLNLVDKRTLTKTCKELGIRNFSFREIKTFGLTSNLVLVIKK